MKFIALALMSVLLSPSLQAGMINPDGMAGEPSFSLLGELQPQRLIQDSQVQDAQAFPNGQFREILNVDVEKSAEIGVKVPISPMFSALAYLGYNAFSSEEKLWYLAPYDPSRDPDLTFKSSGNTLHSELDLKIYPLAANEPSVGIWGSNANPAGINWHPAVTLGWWDDHSTESEGVFNSLGQQGTTLRGFGSDYYYFNFLLPFGRFAARAGYSRNYARSSSASGYGYSKAQSSSDIGHYESYNLGLEFYTYDPSSLHDELPAWNPDGIVSSPILEAGFELIQDAGSWNENTIGLSCRLPVSEFATLSLSLDIDNQPAPFAAGGDFSSVSTNQSNLSAYSFQLGARFYIPDGFDQAKNHPAFTK